MPRPPKTGRAVRRRTAPKSRERRQGDVPASTAAPHPIAAALPAAPRSTTGPSTTFDPNVAAHILERIADGETLTSILWEPGMPTYKTWNVWTLAIKELRVLHLEARQSQAHTLFNEALDIARDLKARADKIDNPTINALRVAIETLKWAASKLLPSEYGERPPSQPTLAVQINTGLDLGLGDTLDSKTGQSIYNIKVVVPPADARDAFPKASAQGQGSEAPADADGTAADPWETP